MNNPRTSPSTSRRTRRSNRRRGNSQKRKPRRMLMPSPSPRTYRRQPKRPQRRHTRLSNKLFRPMTHQSQRISNTRIKSIRPSRRIILRLMTLKRLIRKSRFRNFPNSNNMSILKVSRIPMAKYNLIRRHRSRTTHSPIPKRANRAKHKRRTITLNRTMILLNRQLRRFKRYIKIRLVIPNRRSRSINP